MMGIFEWHPATLKGVVAVSRTKSPENLINIALIFDGMLNQEKGPKQFTLMVGKLDKTIIANILLPVTNKEQAKGAANLWLSLHGFDPVKDKTLKKIAENTVSLLTDDTGDGSITSEEVLNNGKEENV